jgi:MFS family permease
VRVPDVLVYILKGKQKTMVRNIVNKLLAKTHFWRDIGFDELSRLYVGMMFRSLALSLIGIFVPVFLLQSGYGLTGVISFFIFFFAGRTIWDVLGGYVTAWIGPKHTILISYISQIAASAMFLSLPYSQWPLVLPALLWGLSNSLFFVAFHVDFSKVKHSDHGGKELGFINAVERIGGALGPITGGVIAFLFGAQYIFLVAIFLLLAGLVPLFRTGEPTKTHQHIDFKGLPVDKMKRDLFSYAAITIENNLCLVLWPLFLALFVLGENVYIKLGGLASLGVLASIAAAYGIGKLVDNKQGGKLLNYAAVVNTLLYGVRPFVTTLPVALAVNLVNEVVTVGYRIPYHKGMYDAVDQLPGFRIAYITTMESLASFSKLFVWLQLYLVSLLITGKAFFVTGFLIAAVASLLIMTQRYTALRYPKSV